MERVAELSERVFREIRPGGAGEVEGVDPRTEAMAGKGAEEAFLGAFVVGDDDVPRKTRSELGPEGEKGRGIGEVGGGDAVDLLRGPVDGLVGVEVGDENVVVGRRRGPAGDADLDGCIVLSAGGSGGFEIDGGEDGVSDEHGN